MARKKVSKKRGADRGRGGGRRSVANRRSGGSRGFYRGEEGMARVDTELERQEAKREARRSESNMPFRLYLAPGSERQVVVLDEKPDFFMYEHQIYNGKNATPRYTHVGCCKEFETCPVCEETGQDSSYNMYLTVLDLEEYEDRRGNVHEFSRKLMVVKPQSQKKFIRRYQKDETLRGRVLNLTRDGDKDPVIGNDIEFDDWMEEDELVEYVRVWEDREGKEHEEDCSQAFVYEELFEPPDPDALADQFGAKATPGSRRQRREEVDEDDGWEEEEGAEEEWEEESPRARRGKKKAARAGRVGRSKKKAASRRGARDEEEVDDESEEDYEEEEAAPRRRTRVDRSRGRDRERRMPRRAGSSRRARG